MANIVIGIGIFSFLAIVFGCADALDRIWQERKASWRA
jgi:hypothetical protein